MSIEFPSNGKWFDLGVKCYNREVLEGRGMKATYDRQTDTLTVILRDGVRVTESDEDKPGVVLDYDAQGNLVSLEVLDASRRVSEASKMEFQTTG